MLVTVEAALSSSPLSPEQRAAGALPPHCVAAVIDGDLNPVRLRAALQAAVDAHGALRTALVTLPGFRGLRQQVQQPAPSLDWRNADLSDPQELRAWREALLQEPWAPVPGRVLRIGLVRLGEARHQLVLAASASALDGASLRQLLAEVCARYRGEAVPGADETFQYTEYVEWRLALTEGDEADRGRAHWDAFVRDVAGWQAPRLAYRTDSAAGSSARVEARRHIDEAAWLARLDARAEAAGTSVATLLQATWWLLLARLTGSEGFIGGWQHDCRLDYEPLQGALGVFEKVLPVAVRADQDEPFARWVERFAQTAAAHVDAQEQWPVDAPPIDAHLRVGCLCVDVPAPAWPVDLAPGPMACFELALHAEHAGQRLSLAVVADASHYTEAAAERLLMQFHALLDAALAQPQAPVGTLPLVGDEERGLLLALRGPTVSLAHASLASVIDHWAAATPDAPALEAGTSRLGYAALQARTHRLAHWMQAQGATAGSLVALNLPRSPELVMAMLASWRIGAGYLAADTEWPAARRDAVLADAAPALVIEALPGEAELSAYPATAPAVDASARDVAYVLYTSGSTGTPKGVVIEQGALLNYVAAASAAMELAASSRWGLTSTVAADLGHTALFGALFNGACLVIAAPEDTRDAQAFAAFLRGREIDALKIVPSHLEALIEDDASHLPGTLVLGGEATPRALVERLQRLSPQTRIFNHYGPTETTVGVMVHRVSADDARSPVLPLTTVLANSRVLVLDEAMALVPAGALGQLHVGGAQLCRGYLNALQAPFVPDPFHPGERLYRTGDLAQVLPEGGLRLAGRIDDQVKVRGFRVEPAEVEAALLAQAGVRQAAVLAVPGSAGGARLRAYAVVDAGVSAVVLTDGLQAVLPAHMLPSSCTLVDAFPRLANGKIDRRELAKRSDDGPPGKAPRNDLEALLAGWMAALVRRSSVGVDADFFDIGGHSLLVIKLVSRIRKGLGLEIAPAVVFDHPSAEALAAALLALADDAGALEARATQGLAA